MFLPNYTESTFEETKCYFIRKLTFDKVWVQIYEMRNTQGQK